MRARRTPLSKSSQSRGWKLGARWATVLLGAAVLAGAPRPAEAQPKAIPHALPLAEAERLTRGADKLREEGTYDAALPLAERALTLREKALGPDHPDVATSLNTLAVLYIAKGDYARAEPLALRGLAIREKALGPDHPAVAISLNDLAVLYWDKGDYARNEPLYQRSLAIWEKALGPDHPLVALSLNNLAKLYWYKGDDAAAEPLFQRSLAIREKALGPDHPDIATSLHNLALLYHHKGDYTAAEPLYQRSLAIRKKALGPDRPRVATSLHHLARLYRDKGDYAAAEPLFQRALAIWEKALGPDYPTVAEVLYNLAALEEAREDYPRALTLSQRAAEIREKNLALLLTADAQAQKRAYLDKVVRDMDHDLWLALHTGDRKATELALTTLLRRKGRALDATADSMRVLRARLGPDEQKLFDDLLTVRSERSTLTLRGPAARAMEDYRKRLAELEAQDQQIEAAISARSAPFRTREQPITVASVKAALPEGAALVEWTVYRPFHPRAGTPEDQWGPPRYAACVLPQEGAPACVDLGEAKPIEAAVTRLRRGLSRAAGQNVPKLARDLDALAMAPARKLLGNTRWVFLSPDGALNLVPFAALVDEGGRYLVESYAFSYLTSGRDLLRLRAEAPAPRDKATVVAAPDFDASGPAAPAGDDKAKAERGVASRDLSGVSFPALPGTETEARAVAGELRPSRLFVGEAATEQAIKALRGPSVLHIATHGFFLLDKPEPRVAPRADGSRPPITREDPLLRSGLALAGANPRKSGADDGVLTALEVTGQDLYGTKLVVLSACETAVGEVINGDGVYGLRRALVLAGSRTQVMSLWKVDDAATQHLMTAYYRRLQQGGGRSEAMRQVQLAMLAEGERVRPYYWASFIVSGDWTSLEGKPAVPALGRVHPGPRGCACALGAPPSPAGAGWAALAALGLGLARWRARRRRRGGGAARGRQLARPSHDLAP